MASTPTLQPCASLTELTRQVCPRFLFQISSQKHENLPKYIPKCIRMFLFWFQEVGKSLQTCLNVWHHLGVDGFWTFPCLVCFILSGLVLVTDAITAMGLPPGRHTLGQQVIEIQGLHAYVAGLMFFRRCYLTGPWFPERCCRKEQTHN